MTSWWSLNKSLLIERVDIVRYYYNIVLIAVILMLTLQEKNRDPTHYPDLAQNKTTENGSQQNTVDTNDEKAPRYEQSYWGIRPKYEQTHATKKSNGGKLKRDISEQQHRHSFISCVRTCKHACIHKTLSCPKQKRG